MPDPTDPADATDHASAGAPTRRSTGPDRVHDPDPAAHRAHAVCVFASSSNDVDERHRELARQLGRGIAEVGWRLVYGGGQAGLMGEVAHAALDAGGLVTGILPRQLNSVELAFDGVTELVMVDSLAERKQLMDQRSNAFAVLPGGVGTLDEITDVLTTRHLGFHQRPLVLVDPDGFWAPLHDLLSHMVNARLLADASARLPVSAPTIQAAIAALAPPGPD